MILIRHQKRRWCLLLLMVVTTSPSLVFWGCQKKTGSEDESNQAFGQISDGSTVSASIDLRGPWQFKAVDEEEWMEAIVPSTVWTDLLRVGRIEDPFYRDNELNVQWVEKKEWEYRRNFTVDESFIIHDRVILECRGLDTVAEVYLNGKLVAKRQNMFIEYEFDIKPFLRSGENQIHIIFRSVLDWNRKYFETDPRVVWKNEKGNIFYTRREGSDYGWDWGVRLLTCGIWKSIRLTAYDTGRITDVAIQQDLSNPEKAVLEITVQVEQFGKKEMNLDIQILFDGKIVSTANRSFSGHKINLPMVVEKPHLWWPNGWGEQPLYTVRTTLKDHGNVIHIKQIRVGLRTVELVREKDERGETFGFKVNGFLMFCKGANWIPLDALPDRIPVVHYKRMLRSCKEANINMLRLWAGGLYEADCFYDFCDEYGILIWHDFMFAVGPFFADSSYLANVKEEILNVVRRLKHHPSIALWCGNNEVESGMARSWVKQYETVTWEGYDKIFNETIPYTVAMYDPDRPYWPGSPHHPLDREMKNPDFETASGDAHIWDVWHGGLPFSWYTKNLDFRFVSEYGFQGLPTMETVRSFTAPEDRFPNSVILDHHNKAGKRSRLNQDTGNIRIARYMASMFAIPSNFENWVYVSQVMHGEGMKIGSETFRRNFPRTSGALYWQLNDNWPTISGSSIDYYGRWKALHYMARHFFNPVLVTGWVEGTTVKIWGVNDHLEETPAVLHWTLARFDGTEVKSGEQEIHLPPNSSRLIAEFDFEEEVGENRDQITYRKEKFENRGNHYLSYKLVHGDQVLSSNVSFFVLHKYLQLEDPNLEYRIKKEKDSLEVTITADRFAAYVELGLKNGYARFSDNYFHLLPGETRKIDVVESEVSHLKFRNLFYLKSLFDSYQ